MKIEASSFLWHNVSARKTKHRKYDALCKKIIPDKCPKCNNNQRFHKFGKDKFGHQKYRCLVCKHQFAPDFMPKNRSNKYPPALYAENLHFCITIIVIIQMSVAAIKSVITLSLYQNQLLPYLPPCPLCLVKMI